MEDNAFELGRPAPADLEWPTEGPQWLGLSKDQRFLAVDFPHTDGRVLRLAMPVEALHRMNEMLRLQVQDRGGAH